MRGSLRIRALTGTALGVVAGLALTGCANARPADSSDIDPVTLAALASVDADVSGQPGWLDDQPGWRGRGGPWGHRHPLFGAAPRGAGLHGAGLHGELTVQTEDGPQTIVVQRGTIDAIDGDTLTIESADGFTLDWTCADECQVIDDHEKVDLSRLAPGTEVGVVGVRDSDGGSALARVVRRPATD
jgi:hypothetical protein